MQVVSKQTLNTQFYRVTYCTLEYTLTSRARRHTQVCIRSTSLWSTLAARETGRTKGHMLCGSHQVKSAATLRNADK